MTGPDDRDTALDLMSDRVFDLFTVQPVDLDPEFTYDFLGVRSRIGFNFNWASSGGKVKPKMLGSWEWIPLLWSVATSGPSVVMFECGAGWAPWIVRGHAAARLLGRQSIRIIGIEAEEHHHRFMQDHFADNSVRPEEGKAVLGIVSPDTGIALFPVSRDPSREWGLRMLGRAGTDRDQLLADLAAEPLEGVPGHYVVGARRAEYRLVPAFSLTELMADHPHVDYIHFDIQGAEADVVTAAIGEMNAKVRCITVGTHSSEIEEKLRKLLPANDWLCVHDEVQKPRPNGVLGDGNQVWVNRRHL